MSATGGTPAAEDLEEDWTCAPPANDPLDDPLFCAELCVEVARRNLRLRMQQMAEARRELVEVHAAAAKAREAALVSIRVLSDVLYELAEVRS